MAHPLHTSFALKLILQLVEQCAQSISCAACGDGSQADAPLSGAQHVAPISPDLLPYQPTFTGARGVKQHKEK